ncbi:hypothetical protein BDN72DRAFT_846373 [Pluteus cervinus]|uniref:Uncharacterized protein n=1 Tax=Pluteus cervinus TaxID=181527 RepID=A0ACD3AGK2_9AGAR|nr:hypothetical protein BDN72DRAFT_846373 [Pluteus cervinus]
MDHQPTQHRAPENDSTAQESALGIPEIISRIFDHLSVPLSTLHDLQHLNEPPMQPTAPVAPAAVRHTSSCSYCGRQTHCQLPPPPPPPPPPESNEDLPKARLDEVRLCRSSLLSAATSCRSLSGPALDALWRQMDTLAPLVSLLPLANVRGVAYLQMQNVSATVLEAFGQYARRIRVFVYQNNSIFQGTGLTFHNSVYANLLASRGVLLPSLRTLLVPVFDQEAFSHDGIYLASPSLTRLEIGGLKITNYALESFMTMIGSRSQHLRHVSTGQNVVVSPAVWSNILTKNLRSIELFKPVPEVLKLLSSFPSLHAMTIINPPKLTTTLTFPSIKRLSLCGTLSSVVCFLEPLHGPLDSISITLQAGSTSFPLSEFELITKTVSNQWKSSLAHLTLDFGNKDVQGLDLSLEFQPFFSLPLRTFRILNFPKRLDSPDVLVEIASKLRGIESLHIPPHTRGKEPSIEDLRTVAQLCPSLRVLSTSVNIEPARDLPSFTHHELDELHVYASPINSPKKVAAQLDRTFPYLKNITTSSPDHFRKWNEVERLLELCHQGRRGFF